MVRNRLIVLLLSGVFWCSTLSTDVAAQVSVQYSQSVQATDVSTSTCGELDLYCVVLHPTARAGNASGSIKLLRPQSVFGVSVSREGRQRYIPEVSVRDLPDPSMFGDYAHYVVWALPPDLSIEQNIGFVTNGTARLSEVSFNKFLIIISPESSATATSRSGPLILRGQSPSNRMQSHAASEVASIGISVGSLANGELGNHYHGGEWEPPPGHRTVPMMPEMSGTFPSTRAWSLELPMGKTIDHLSAVRPSRILNLADGDTLHIKAGLVKKEVEGQWQAMYAYNGQIPGPTLRVKQAASLTVVFENDTEFRSSIHWHGLRHDNKDDGVPGVTQQAVEPGQFYTYTVRFPDSGLYWYHPHHREDIQQELGLAGNMLVDPETATEHGSSDHQEIFMLDDILLDDKGSVPFGASATNYASMGRFGNALLVNGESHYEKTIRAGESIRFYVTNVSNTRTFNVSVAGHVMKIIATDISRFENESWEETITIAPAERYTADVRFDKPGRFAIVNHIQGIDHQLGRFFTEIDTLGIITVDGEQTAAAQSNLQRVANTFDVLQHTPDVASEIDRYRSEFDRLPDREIDLILETDSLPPVIEQIMRLDRLYFNPVEWSGTMPMMNWATTANEIRWILRDTESGLDNTDISWRAKIGTVEKIRLNNRTDGIHAMQHPIHLHGQRFLVLSYNGQPTGNLAWKDTILIPTGMTADILIEYTNPGLWMMHCHIAEHLETGMKLVFEVYK